jgi:hypothetical protein
MRQVMSFRVQIGLVLLLVFPLALSSWMIGDVARRAPTNRHPEALRDWEKRFVEVRPLLPPRGVVGHVATSDNQAEELYRTQYVLTPLVVKDRGDLDLVVGTFTPGTEPPLPPTPRHEVLLADRGRGVVCWKVK